MKTKLLIALLFTPIILTAQSVASFFSEPSTQYAIVQTAAPLDQSEDGMNATWTFTNFTATTVTSTDSYADIVEGDPIKTEYPLTNYALTTTASNADEINFYSLFTSSGDVDITGLESTGLKLQYSDVGRIGLFPYAYNNSNGGNIIAGNLNYDGNAGTFTGVLTSTVDAYGTLSMNDVGGGAYTGTVTRLKIVQDIDLFVAIKVGDLIQTSYHYYDNATGNLVFRSTDINVTSIIGNSASTLMESLISDPLSVSQFNEKVVRFRLKSNPVSDLLKIELKTGLIADDVMVYNVLGKEVYRSTFTSEINVNQLEAGFYILYLRTNEGLLSTKFIKN